MLNNADHKHWHFGGELELIPRFADKHHPVALVLICGHDVEFQHIVVVHLKWTDGFMYLEWFLHWLWQPKIQPNHYTDLPYLWCVLFWPVREIYIATMLAHHWSKAGPWGNDVPCKNSWKEKHCVSDRTDVVPDVFFFVFFCQIICGMCYLSLRARWSLQGIRIKFMSITMMDVFTLYGSNSL